MKKTIIVLLFLAFSGYILTVLYPGYSYGTPAGKSFETLLPKKLYRALTAEMNALQHGFSNLAIAIPAGRLGEVAEIARKMKQGYIMKNVLSEEQVKELNNALPSEYHRMNREFYDVTEKLNKSAKEKDRKNVISHFYRLTEKCVQCHEKFAQKRFPDFADSQGVKR